MPIKALISLLAGLLLTWCAAAQVNYNNLEFIENKGQWHADVLYKSDLGNGAFFLRRTGFTIVQHHPDDLRRAADQVHGHMGDSNYKILPFTHNGFVKKGPAGKESPGSPDTVMNIRSHSYTMDFLHANPNALLVAEKPQQDYTNYFIGNDSSKWASHCRIFQAVTYKNIYPGIDVKYYTEAGSPKYEFIVNAGADPSQIAMKFNGADKLGIRNNQLIITTSAGEVKELAPYTYQPGVNGRRTIDCRYKLEKDNVVRFVLKEYTAGQPLIIDPTMVFASLSGSGADNWGYTATYGLDGSFYSGGIVFGSGYRVSPGAYMTSYQGAFDMGIMKLSSNGSQRLYATYIGGGGQDQPHSLFCDQQGNLVIAGRTNSSFYPGNVFSGAGGIRGWDIVVTKLNASGTNIIGSVRIGGTGDDGFNTRDSHQQGPAELVNNYGDDARSEVILDAANNIYVASCTQSTNFYLTSNAVQTSLNGSQDAVLLKLNPNCNSVLYSSYFGGNGYEAGFVLALNPANSDVYMAGATTSPSGNGGTDIPGSKAGVIQPSNAGGRTDGFVAVFSNDGSVLRRSTYLGTPGIDFIYGIQFDRKGFPYVMGTTTGDWPVINAAYSIAGSKQFVGKLNPDLSGWQYSTVFGTRANTPNISPVAFLVDRCENVYVSGWGKDIGNRFTQAGTLGLPVTNDAIQQNTDNQDFYFIVIKRDASQLLYATFFGQRGGGGEHVDGGTSRFDQNGIIYQAICANCINSQDGSRPRWPVSPGAYCCSSGYAGTNTGGGCNLGSLKIAFNFAGVGSSVKSLIDGRLDSTGCIPLVVNLRDTFRNAKTYEWDFDGDGVTDDITTVNNITHTYPAVGNYRVRLISVDSTTCNIRDTSYITIIAKDNKANLDFSYQKLLPCESLQYLFTNNSTAPPSKPFSAKSFIWDFGDGTRTDSMGTASIAHMYAAPGVYPVRLVLADTGYCNYPDSLQVMLRVSPLVKAQFETPATGCAPYEAFFNNTSLGGETFTWDFGDGSPTSNEVNPVHLYENPGTYTITLRAVDPNTCNVTHDTAFTIIVHAPPTAAYTYTPIPPVENTPNIFTNNSSPDAIRFHWSFGDHTDTLRTTSRAPVEHQYDETFTFYACLVAFNQAGCADTACQEVEVIVSPRLDVPNAFTPTQNNTANKVYVRGFAIGKMHFTIYNRLGQKVFDTMNKTQGWDGRFNGVMQPMDVYGYTLEVEFTDGTRATKKGDITLIR